MRRRSTARLVLALLALLLMAAEVSAYPVDFVDELVAAVPGSPVVFVLAADGRAFVGDIFGSIYVIASNGVLNPTPMITLNVETFEEQGLLGMALDPNFATSHYLYVLYTPKGSTTSNNFHRISRFTVIGNTIALGSEVILHSSLPTGKGFHVAGCLAVGPDGKLYATSGENGYNGTELFPQQLTRLEGKLIRINVNGSIPVDNPFTGTAGARPEIFQYGLRNPFRFTFQPGTGKLWVNDVGSNFSTAWDEINVGGAGFNFGFPLVEGIAPTPPPGVTNPLYAIQRMNASCITAGAFYTYGPYPAGYDGNYFWIDHVRGQINRMQLNPNGSVLAVTIPWGQTASGGWYFGAVDLKMGRDGALYYCTYDPGQLRRIRYAATVAAPPTAEPRMALERATPNPFASATQVRFSLDRSGPARLQVFDLSGRRLQSLVDESLAAGEHVATWSGRDAEGRSMPPGIFLIRLEAAGRHFTQRVALVR